MFHAAIKNRFVDGKDIRLVNLRSIVSFTNYKLTTSSRKHLEVISLAHTDLLMYKLIT